MNKYYEYDNFELWQKESWASKVSPLAPFVSFMCPLLKKTEGKNYVKPECDDPKLLPYYQHKSGSVDDPKILGAWKDRGMVISTREMGSFYWYTAVPGTAMKDITKKIPIVVVLNKVDYTDPFWAMRLIGDYNSYYEKAFEENFIVIHVAIENVDNEMQYANILQEAFVLYPADPERTYLDVSEVISSGHKLSEAEGYTYTDRDGTPIDPDASVYDYHGIPVLDISRRWENMDSLGRWLIMDFTSNNTGIENYNREWMLHSDMGKRVMEGVKLEYDYKDLEGPIKDKYWDKMGLRFDINRTNGLRWTALTPKQAFEEPDKKLPIFVVMQEVYDGNDHFALTAHSYYYEVNKLAAQGECIALYFVMEDLESNDNLVDILYEAEKLYPADLSRVYITGHSHDGYYCFEFARRHPELIAAVATMGNACGMVPLSYTGNRDLFRSDEEMEEYKKMDMPVINLTGCGERGSLFPVQKCTLKYRNGDWMPRDFESKAKIWQRRLYYSNCPVATMEEIIAAGESNDRATSKLGIPNDKSETLWLDGFEHYIVDIKNNFGKYHLRIVGVENMPHIPLPSYCDIAWSYMRRFARNRETLEIIELYGAE